MTTSSHQTHIYIGLAGEGDAIGPGGMLRRAHDDPDWQPITNGLPPNPQVRALAMHPRNPAILFAGTQHGPYRSDDRGAHWQPLDAPKGDVWSLAFSPADPNIIYAGYEPCAIARSEDGGETWRAMDTSAVRYPDVTTYMPPLAKRVIGICADPSEPADVYGAIEVGGLIASADGGETWRSLTDGLYRDNHTVDLHGVQVSAAAPGVVFIIAQVAMFRSRNKGGNWEHIRFAEMFPGGSYCRDLLVAPDDPREIYLCAGAGGGGAPPGTPEAGALFRSQDAGETWHRIDIGDTPPGRMFQVAIDPNAPDKIFCTTNYGHFFASADRGETWTSHKIPLDLKRGYHIYPMVSG